MNYDKIWSDCLFSIKENIRDESFKTWFEPTKLIDLSNNIATIETDKGDIHANFIEDKYSDLIISTLEKQLNIKVKLKIVGIIEPLVKKIDVKNKENKINEDFTFSNFIVGQTNEFAHSAALAVAEAPGATRFNPLFIYGTTGLGKTHLIQAIANYVSDEYSEKEVLYINSAQFVEEYIKSIENKKIDKFNDKYKNCDFLLIDDIQFLAGKQGTQDTFFHIFNELYNDKKQIVLTSDKYPKDLDGLEVRLVSRFQSGLMVDIQPPTLEMKMAIINKKAKKNKLNLDEDVIEYVAKNSSQNIREMEGNLIKLLAYSSMYNEDINYTKAVEILGLERGKDSKRIYIEEVIEKVSEYFRISQEKIIKGNREKELVIPRQVAMYLSRKFTNSSLKNIGKIFMKDHSTIVHGVKNIEKIIKNDNILKEDIHKISVELFKQ